MFIQLRCLSRFRWLCLACLLCASELACAQSGSADIVDLTIPTKAPTIPAKAPTSPANETHSAEVLEPQPDPVAADNPNQPRVVISADGEARPGCWYMLDGSACSDPLKYKLTLQWRQLAGPSIPLNGESDADSQLWLFLVQPGDYRFELKVTNEAGVSATRDAKFSVPAGRSVLSESEGRKLVGFGEQVELPGEDWTQIAGPSVELKNARDGYSFRPARAGFYLFEAPRAGDVPERRGVVVPPGRTPPFGDRRPIVYLPKNLTGTANKPLIVDGSLSRHPDGPEETQALKANWITLDKDRGVELKELPGLRASFTAGHSGEYELKLSVSDGKLASAPESVFIRIEHEEDEDTTQLPIFEDPPELIRDDIRLSHDHVRLGLWEANLDRAVQLFPSRAGAALRVDPELAKPENFEQIPLAIEVLDGPLKSLIDGIARQTDSWYRKEKNVSFWLTRNNGWIKDEQIKTKVIQADALCAKNDGSDFLNLIRPWAQRMMDGRENMTLNFTTETQSVVATLPVSVNARLEEICAALRIPNGNGLPPPDLPSGMEWKLRKLLAEKKITIKAEHYRVDLLLREVGQQTGVAIGMDSRQFPRGAPRVDIDVKDQPLRDVIRTIVDLAEFDGCSVEPPAGLWLYKGPRPYPDRELLWDQTIVQAYDLSRLLAQIAPISGEVVAHEIQCRIYPDSWSDPGALIFYHAPTGKLLVMHGAAAHNRILEFLMDLSMRGEWALGPVEESTKQGSK